MAGGRPTVMTPEAIAKLEEAFSNGASDLEACFLANISKDSLYRYQQENPEFCDRKEALKDMIKYQARLAIKEALNDEKTKVETAKWYLERKDKRNFSTRTELTGEDGEKLQPVLVEFINGTSKDTNTGGVQKTI